MDSESDIRYMVFLYDVGDVVYCVDPGEVTFAVRQGTATSFPSGTLMNYTCIAGYIGGGTMTCQNGTWSALPTCYGMDLKYFRLYWSVL